jgi:hypothetical protein
LYQPTKGIIISILKYFALYSALKSHLLLAFNSIFLFGAIISLSLVALMIIMKRRALKMGMPANK